MILADAPPNSQQLSLKFSSLYAASYLLDGNNLIFRNVFFSLIEPTDEQNFLLVESQKFLIEEFINSHISNFLTTFVSGMGHIVSSYTHIVSSYTHPLHPFNPIIL